MSTRVRFILLLLGLLIVLFSMVALAYAIGPVTNLHDQAILAPTLFSPP